MDSISPQTLAFTLPLLVVSLLAAGHAVLNKRDPRAGILWLGLCLFLPGIGAFFYWLFGINRIRTYARQLHHRGGWRHATPIDPKVWPPRKKRRGVGERFEPLRGLAETVTRRPVLPGNKVFPLFNGEEAYPAMLEAIHRARHTVYLSTYIFDADETGRMFVGALARARQRGVDVRVLVDAIGEKYSRLPISRLLKERGVNSARFLSMGWDFRQLHLNMRNHRKLLLVDHQVGFLGGMNIRNGHWASRGPEKARIQDVHFRVEGPAVLEMQEVFLEDWYFATRESLPWRLPPVATRAGLSNCRVIGDGPNEEFEKTRHLLLGIMAWARKNIRIMTPYFVPDRVLIAGIQHAALRGVEVDLILPGVNNLPLVAWASRAYLWEILIRGVRVYEQPAPFAHTKILTADGAYALVGSSNLDNRSLRLNFECNLEVYDPIVARKLERRFDEVRARSKPLTLAGLNDEPLAFRLRNATCKLLSPLL